MAANLAVPGIDKGASPKGVAAPHPRWDRALMNVLRSLEAKLADLVEGTFGRVFRSEVQPIQIAHKLAREMDEHRTVSVSRVYAPNEYLVWLSPEDRGRYEGVEAEVIDELSVYLLEHARREGLALASRPVITFHTDERLSLGEFGIQTRLVRTSEETGGEVEQADHGHTMVYSASERAQAPLAAARAGRAPRAVVVLAGKRMLVPPGGAVIGRSRQSDIVVEDANVSRRHAELRPGPQGWTVVDLGSTNGVLVNQRSVEGSQRLASGDRIELGGSEMVFEEQ
jgi:hypothetical protein